MTAKSNFKKPSVILWLIVSVLVGGGLPALAYSSKGKELYADIWLNVITPFFLLAMYLLIIISTWKKMSKKRKIGLTLMTVIVAWLAFSSLSFNWKFLPWGRTSAIETTNNFMKDLKSTDYSSAFEKLSPVTQKHLTPESLNQPNSQPISWQLANIDRNSIVSGTAKFIDGVELPVEIRLRWIDHNWKIYGVQFGEWKKDANGNFEITTRMDFMMCCDSRGFIFDTVFSLIDGNNPFGYNQSQ